MARRRIADCIRRRGGKTWTLSKFISNRAGFIDVAMDPRNPQVLYAASWERGRTPYMIESGGRGSGLWKTTDGGATWAEITGGGFPTGVKGRIGIGLSPSNPDVIYALVEAARPRPEDRTYPNIIPFRAGCIEAQTPAARGQSRTTTTTAHSTILKFASIRGIAIACSSRRRRCSCRSTAEDVAAGSTGCAHRHARCAGSIPRIPSASPSRTTAGSRSRSMAAERSSRR